MPTDIATLHDLVELDEGMSIEHRGNPLSTRIPEGVDLNAWPTTFADDFTDIAHTITGNDGQGPWFAPGTYTSDGTATFSGVTGPQPPIYTQQGGYLGMGVRRNGNQYWSANINTATYSATDINHSPKIGFAQQYGYFECRFKAADPTGSNAILWPSFWVNAVSWTGGSVGNLSVKRIELDIVEMYNTDPNSSTLGKDPDGHHFAVHTHEPAKWVAPGVWGRNVGCSNITKLADNPIWGTAADFTFWQDFHTYGLLITPEFSIVLFDRLEVCRFPMLQEFHNKFYLLVSHQLSRLGPGGMPDGAQFNALIDYVRVWQNPNWQTVSPPILERGALPGAGTANAITFQTIAAMTSYAAGDKRSFVVGTHSPSTGPATADANGLGALPIYKSTASGTVPLTGGEITGGWIALRLDMSLGGGTGGWLLLTPGYSIKATGTYTPPAQNPTSRVIQVEDVEAGLAEKHGIPGSLFPAGHPATSPKVANSAVTPRMPVSLQHTIGTNVRAGDSVVAATVANTPDRPVRYALTDLDGTPNPYFDVHPATGEIFVRENVSAVPAGGYDLALSAWPTPPQAVVPGSNATRIHITVSAG